MLNENQIKDQVLEQLKSFDRASDIGTVQVSTHRFAIAVFDASATNFSRLGNGPAARCFPKARVISSHASFRVIVEALGLIQSELGYKLEKALQP